MIVLEVASNVVGNVDRVFLLGCLVYDDVTGGLWNTVRGFCYLYRVRRDRDHSVHLIVPHRKGGNGETPPGTLF